jgi:hypothetical protein
MGTHVDGCPDRRTARDGSCRLRGRDPGAVDQCARRGDRHPRPCRQIIRCVGRTPRAGCRVVHDAVRPRRRCPRRRRQPGRRRRRLVSPQPAPGRIVAVRPDGRRTPRRPHRGGKRGSRHVVGIALAGTERSRLSRRPPRFVDRTRWRIPPGHRVAVVDRPLRRCGAVCRRHDRGNARRTGAASRRGGTGVGVGDR